MTEPIPSAASPEQPSLPTNAEDRKAAAALSALHANDISAEGEDGAGNEAGGAGGVVGAGGKLPSAADQEALGKAMSQLEIVAGGKKTGAAKKKEQQEEEEAAAAAAAAEAKRRKAIKVSAEDVGLLVGFYFYLDCCLLLRESAMGAYCELSYYICTLLTERFPLFLGRRA